MLSLIFTLDIFSLNFASACVLVSVHAGGKPSGDEAGTFYCGLDVWSCARVRWADDDDEESAGCVTRAV